MLALSRHMIGATERATGGSEFFLYTGVWHALRHEAQLPYKSAVSGPATSALPEQTIHVCEARRPCPARCMHACRCTTCRQPRAAPAARTAAVAQRRPARVGGCRPVRGRGAPRGLVPVRMRPARPLRPPRRTAWRPPGGWGRCCSRGARGRAGRPTLAMHLPQRLPQRPPAAPHSSRQARGRPGRQTHALLPLTLPRGLPAARCLSRGLPHHQARRPRSQTRRRPAPASAAAQRAGRRAAGAATAARRRAACAPTRPGRPALRWPLRPRWRRTRAARRRGAQSCKVWPYDLNQSAPSNAGAVWPADQATCCCCPRLTACVLLLIIRLIIVWCSVRVALCWTLELASRLCVRHATRSLRTPGCTRVAGLPALL